MIQYDSSISAENGAWQYTEVLGNQAIVKVRASAGLLTTIANDALGMGITRLPLAQLSASLASLTAAQRAAIRDRLEAAGYTVAEISARFPNQDLTTVTLGDVLRFLAQRRRKPRWTDGTRTAVVLDGQAVPPGKTVDELDSEVTE
jgi:hypothetical protein